MKLFRKRYNNMKERYPAEHIRLAHDGLQVFDLPDKDVGIYKDYLFGDANTPGRHTILPEFVIDSALTSLYSELDRNLDTIFTNGAIDSCNGDMYDSRIDSAGVIALRSVESQYAWILVQPVQMAVSAREGDIARLAEEDKVIRRELEDADAELSSLLAKEEAVNHFKYIRRTT